MAMKLVRKTADYKIFLRGDNRYAVQNEQGKPVNGEDKVNILIAEELIKVTAPQPSEPETPEVAEDVVAEEVVAEQEAVAEEPAEEEAAPEKPAAEEPATEEAAAEEPATDEKLLHRNYL